MWRPERPALRFAPVSCPQRRSCTDFTIHRSQEFTASTPPRRPHPLRITLRHSSKLSLRGSTDNPLSHHREYGQFPGRAARANQFHHLAPVLRRTRRLCLRHLDTSSAQCSGVHQTGSTSFISARRFSKRSLRAYAASASASFLIVCASAASMTACGVCNRSAKPWSRPAGCYVRCAQTTDFRALPAVSTSVRSGQHGLTERLLRQGKPWGGG